MSLRVLGFEDGYAIVNAGTKQEPVLKRFILFFDDEGILRGEPKPATIAPVDQMVSVQEGAAERRAMAMRSIDQLRQPGS